MPEDMQAAVYAVKKKSKMGLGKKSDKTFDTRPALQNCIQGLIRVDVQNGLIIYR